MESVTHQSGIITEKLMEDDADEREMDDVAMSSGLLGKGLSITAGK